MYGDYCNVVESTGVLKGATRSNVCHKIRAASSNVCYETPSVESLQAAFRDFQNECESWKNAEVYAMGIAGNRELGLKVRDIFSSVEASLPPPSCMGSVQDWGAWESEIRGLLASTSSVMDCSGVSDECERQEPCWVSRPSWPGRVTALALTGEELGEDFPTPAGSFGDSYVKVEAHEDGGGQTLTGSLEPGSDADGPFGEGFGNAVKEKMAEMAGRVPVKKERARPVLSHKRYQCPRSNGGAELRFDHSYSHMPPDPRCIICRNVKMRRARMPRLGPNAKKEKGARRPREPVHLDLLGPTCDGLEGNDTLMVTRDGCSNVPRVAPVCEHSPEVMWNKFIALYPGSRHETPPRFVECISCDNDGSFQSIFD